MLVATDGRTPPSVAPFATGATVFAGALLTGGSFSPARTLGPVVVGGLWTAHWLYWFAPIIGMVAAMYLYEPLRETNAPEAIPPMRTGVEGPLWSRAVSSFESMPVPCDRCNSSCGGALKFCQINSMLNEIVSRTHGSRRMRFGLLALFAGLWLARRYRSWWSRSQCFGRATSIAVEGPRALNASRAAVSTYGGEAPTAERQVQFDGTER